MRREQMINESKYAIMLNIDQMKQANSQSVTRFVLGLTNTGNIPSLIANIPINRKFPHMYNIVDYCCYLARDPRACTTLNCCSERESKLRRVDSLKITCSPRLKGNAQHDGSPNI